ncbi:MAG: two-component sensor histidine kinase [Phycisphaerae bacterium]|nr:MAG: heavy metal sensor histidine kinase [Planctomycetia bacterium]RIK67532.1 MAG: hypothetical protein DCC66_11450 [Planctomycetota bacterium]GJQ24977.1 MAG: two-component sensor histidine kinase [Phycisphaerae bacterium]
MARSVRTRITLLATGVTLGVSTLVCVGVYLALHFALYREVDSFLEGEVHEFRAILTHEQDDDLKEVEREIRAELGSRSNSDLVFRLLRTDGYLLITSDPNDRFPNPWKDSASKTPKASAAWFETIEQPSDPPYRISAQIEQLPVHGDVIIQAAYRLDRVQRSLAMCMVFCIAALVIATALAIIGGRAVARGSMAPVVRITKAARQISAQRLSTRVPLAGSHDELDALAQTLNDMLNRVERSFRQIQQFTADAAHELRTPLTALRGSAEHVLAQPRTESELRAVIEKSLEYYHLLGRVTDDLLLLARLDAGKEPLRFEQFSLSRAVDDVVDLYRPLADEHGIQLNCRRENGEVFVVGDSGKIRRVLNNLLDNSIKYMGGAGTVEVALVQEKSVVLLTVCDTGPGISPEDLPHVFERFYRSDRARSARRDAAMRSAGLGLAICRSIVHAHGGEISLECQTDQGTVVAIHLPLENHGSEN